MEQKIEDNVSLCEIKIKPKNNQRKAKQILYSLLRKRIDEQFIELIYLSPRDTLVPSFMEDDILLGIQKIFSDVFESIVEFVEEISIQRERLLNLEVIVQPSYDSISDIIIINKNEVLFRTREKPHKFIFDSKEELMDYMFTVLEILAITCFSMCSDELLQKYSLLEISKGLQKGGF